MNLPFERIETGMYVPGFRTHARYVRVEYADALWRVFVGIPTMTQEALDALQGGEIRLAAGLFDECVFFLFRFGGLAWFSAPFEPRASAPLPEEPCTRMAFVFIDSDSGVAQGIRRVRLGGDAGAHIARVCAAVPDRPYDRMESLKRQAAVLLRYLSEEDMLRKLGPDAVFPAEDEG